MNSSIVTLILAIWAVSETITAARKGPEYSSLAPAFSPSSDCFSLMNGMMDCISFLSGDDPAPGEACCSGLKNVMEVNAYCICYGLEMGSELGFEINMTRAEAMPDDCCIAAVPPPISFCNMSTAPVASPATTPPSAESPPPAPHFHPPAAAPTPSISPSPESISLPPESISPSPESSVYPSPGTASPSPKPISPSPESSVSPSPGTATPAPSYTPIQPPEADIPAEGEEPSLAPSSDTGNPPPVSDQPRPHPKFAVFPIVFVSGFHLFLLVV